MELIAFGREHISNWRCSIMSRKTLMTVLGVITIIVTFLQEQFGLSAGLVPAVGGVGIALIYVLFEAKLDLKKMGAQPGKWKDPKFWIALAGVLIPELNRQLGLNLPTEAIVAVLGVILAILFGVKFKALAAS